ncbi:MAG: UDP-N-acetylglucosamine 2-epimerase (non-hydrolyzing) [Nitrospirae bacterium]|nr:UDP-N-acetylglucosamine 2-epimerase (non-hydrolyzing) [Nitrospirota bacterium]
MKTLSIFGTRPEAIKMAPVLKFLKNTDGLESIVCVTAQHREMLDTALDLFNIVPDYDFNIMKENQDLYHITSQVLLNLEKVLEKEKPDMVLVQGDTTTTMAASLAAFYQKVPVGHVEAGLRTYDKYAPYPEEVNRRITSVIAKFHFAPTEWAKGNLIKEGISEDQIFVTGNTVVDALKSIIEKIKFSDLQNKFDKMFDFIDKEKRLVLITGHRRESFGDGFINICTAIKELAFKFIDCEFLYPVHLNPNVQNPVKDILGKEGLSNVHLIEPLEYLPFVYLMNKAYIIISDSGGVQEEAPSLGKPVLITRNITERPEGVAAGVARLAGNNKEGIFKEVSLLLGNEDEYKLMSTKKNPYGEGKAAEQIVNIIVKKLREK